MINIADELAQQYEQFTATWPAEAKELLRPAVESIKQEVNTIRQQSTNVLKTILYQNPNFR